MQVPTRDHSNFLKKNVEDPIVLHEDPHLTEQQHRADCDATRIMQRFDAGLVPLASTAPVYGERDYTVSRSDAVRASRQLVEWYNTLPPSIRRTYADAAAVIRAIHSGDLLWEIPAAAVPAGSSAGGDGAAPAGAPPEGQAVPKS